MTTPAPAALDGMRVVSLAVNLPGPLAASRLAALGATVTKVEPPSGDPLAHITPSWYAELAEGQEVVTLDLKSDEGRADLENRLAGADILLTSMRPSALERLGLRESVERHGLLLVEIVGYDGEREDEAGHDLTYQAVQGMLTPPSMPTIPMVDILGSERAVTAALAGLRRREISGQAVSERVALEDAAVYASAALRHRLTGPGDILGGALPTYGIYASADGHVAVAALEPHFAERLAEHVGADSQELATAFAAESSAHWEEFGRTHDIPIVEVVDPRRL